MDKQGYLRITDKTEPEEALTLPKGRLKIGQFVVDFSPEQVLAAATQILTYPDVVGEDPVFVSQAGVIAYASNTHGIMDRLKIETF